MTGGGRVRTGTDVLAGARVLITGASSGIGHAAALALAEAGCSLVLSGRDTTRLAAVATATGGTHIPADLADHESLGRLISRVMSDGVPDIVVHSAGVGRYAPAVDDDGGAVERVMGTNLTAPIRLTAALLPGMLERGSGRLVFITSIAGELGVAGESAYAASKAGLAVYAASLRAELARSGVGVTTVVPGVVDTPFFEQRGAPYTRRFPRPIPADQVARALVRALRTGRSHVVVPPWLRLPVAVRALAPEMYDRLAGRFG